MPRFNSFFFFQLHDYTALGMLESHVLSIRYEFFFNFKFLIMVPFIYFLLRFSVALLFCISSRLEHAYLDLAGEASFYLFSEVLLT